MNLLCRSLFYAALHFWAWMYLVSGEIQSEDDTQAASSGSSSYWSILAAAAAHTCVSIWALLKLMDAPPPVPCRLPKMVKPLQYSLDFIPEYQQHVFSAHETILVRVVQPTRNITLHSRDLIIDESKLSLTEQSSSKKIAVSSLEEEKQNNWVIIELLSELQTDQVYALDIYFTGLITDTALGLLIHNYEDKYRWIMMTHFEPTGARYAFPCFDEPSFKARFSINIANPPGYHALSNMPLKEASEPVAGHPGWVWSRFEQSVPMSTYLVGFVVSDFVSVDGVRNFSTWVQPGQEKHASSMVRLGPLVLAALEEFTDFPFMLPKLDNIAIPSLPSLEYIVGSETWGIIMYTDANILLDENVTSSWQKRIMIRVLTHELAHNWFGNLVTPQYWDDLWLKEGFARYIEYHISSKVLPTWAMQEDFQIYAIQKSMLHLDATVIKQVANTDKEIMAMYNVRTYSTGAALIHMMEHILTMDIFLAGIRLYLKSYAYQSASTKEFFDVIDNAVANTSSNILPSGVELGEVMRPWFSQPRYPLITVSRNYTTGQVTICQEEILQQEYRWWVPLSYTTQSEADFNQTSPRLWLSPNDSCINVWGLVEPHEWIIFNIRQTGYYRVNYDEKNWKLLSDFLKSEKYSSIHILNRAQLLDDAINLVIMERLSVAVALNVTNYLAQEVHPFPWLVTLKSSGYIDGFNQSYLTELMQTFYNQVSGLPGNITQRNGPQLWEKILDHRCYKLPQCIEDSYKHLKALQANPANYSLDPGLKDAIICSAVKHKDVSSEDIMFLWKMAKKSSNYVMLSPLIWCPRKYENYQSIMIAAATDGDWLSSKQMAILSWSVCRWRASMGILEGSLKYLQTQHIGPAPPIDLYLLQTITTTIRKLPTSNMRLYQLWCQLSLAWLTRSPLSVAL